jgi:serine/threonine-protein kinase RsbT
VVSPLEQAFALVLRRYMSEISARSVLRRAMGAIGASDRALTEGDAARLREALETGVRLFVDPALQPRAIAELGAVESGPVVVEADVLTIESDSDVSRARLRAREIALALGATALGVQRAATVASELTRNIVAYAREGRLEITPIDGAPPSVLLRATDRGPGITELAAIFAGTYRSKTGLGKGLLGAKKLSRRFDVKSDKNGTEVECEIGL